jgi:hypothetical protein
MFELDHAIEDWKHRFAQLDSVRGPDVEELEQHVRDSVVALTSKGLTEEEAFLIATRRVGAPSEVGREYEKVQPGYAWARRVLTLPAKPAALVILNIVGFCAIAWMIDAEIDDVQRAVGPLRAALDEYFVVDQDVFSHGQGRFNFPLDNYQSTADFIDNFESTIINSSVSSGSYGREWILVDQRGETLPQKNENLEDAGVKPGAVYRVERARRLEDGRQVF